jgi:hypothetical protein
MCIDDALAIASRAQRHLAVRPPSTHQCEEARLGDSCRRR